MKQKIVYNKLIRFNLNAISNHPFIQFLVTALKHAD